MSEAPSDSEVDARPERQPTPGEVERIVQQADGVLGSSGRSVTDAGARDVIRQHIRGDISLEVARQRIVNDALTRVPNNRGGTL